MRTAEEWWPHVFKFAIGASEAEQEKLIARIQADALWWAESLSAEQLRAEVDRLDGKA